MFFRRTCWKIEKLATALPEDERQCQYRLKMIIGGNVAKSNIITTTVVVKVAKSVVTTASRRRVWRRRPQCNDGVPPLYGNDGVSPLHGISGVRNVTTASRRRVWRQHHSREARFSLYNTDFFRFDIENAL